MGIVFNKKWVKGIYYNGNPINRVYCNGILRYQKTDLSKYLHFTNESDEVIRIRLENHGVESVPQLEYHMSNTGTWYTYETFGAYIDIQPLQTIYLRRKEGDISSSFSTGESSYIKFAKSRDGEMGETVSLSAGGNIMSLLSYDADGTDVPDYSFYKLFESLSCLSSPPELPAQSVGAYSYSEMFSGCTQIVSAPTLPATEIGEGCYKEMFLGCTALENTQEALPANVLENYCYQAMYQNCTSLEVSPKLQAVTLVDGCYKEMFSGCSRLNHIECLAYDGILSQEATSSWTDGVADSGTFVKKALVGWEIGIDGIPLNWIPQEKINENEVIYQSISI